MKTTDREMLEILRKSVEKEKESMMVPEALSKENIVRMLKEESAEPQRREETGSDNSNIVVLRRLTAVAAVFVVVLLSVIIAGYKGNTSIIQKYRSFRGFDSENPIKQVSDYDEIGNAVRDINKETKTEASSKTGLTDEENETLEKFRALFREKIGFAIDEERTDAEIQEVKAKPDYQQADIVKSNGNNLFILTINGKSNDSATEIINIVDISDPAEMKKISDIKVSSGSSEDRCIEMYLNNSTLILIVARNESHASYTSAQYYDISDPGNPHRVRTHTQEGTYVYSKISSGKLVLITNKSVNGITDDELIPCYTVNGVPHKLGTENVFVSVNAPDGSYMFVTVTDLSDMSAETGSLAMLGCGKNVTAVNDGIYVTRAFTSLENDEKKTEISGFSFGGARISLSGTYTLDGNVIGGLCSDNSGAVRMFVQSGESVTAVRLSRNMEPVTQKTVLENTSVSAVSYVGNSAVVAGSSGKYLVDFAEDGTISCSNAADTMEAGNCLIQYDDSHILSVENETATKIKVFDGTSLTDTYEISEGICSLVKDDPRTVAKSSDGKYFGIPVTYDDKDSRVTVSAYMIFDFNGEKISLVGVYVHEPNYVGDAATRAVISGNSVFTVSGEKIVAFSVPEAAVISSLRTD